MNNIILGDCLEKLNELESNSIDLVLSDLPFGLTKNRWDQLIPLKPLWEQLERVTRPSSAILLHAIQPFASMLIMSNPSMYRYDWVWEKTTATGHLNAKKMPMRAHEYILVFYKKLPTYNPQKTFGHERKVSLARHQKSGKGSDNYNEMGTSDYDSTERYPRSVLRFSTDTQKSALHPTQKPIALLEYFISTYSNKGDVVLDVTAGSGSTGEACLNSGRGFILVEKEQRYYDIMCERLGETNAML